MSCFYRCYVHIICQPVSLEHSSVCSEWTSLTVVKNNKWQHFTPTEFQISRTLSRHLEGMFVRAYCIFLLLREHNDSFLTKWETK